MDRYLDIFLTGKMGDLAARGPYGYYSQVPTRDLKMYANGLVRYLEYGGVVRGGWVASKCEEDGKVG